MQTLQRVLSKIVHADCKEYYLKLYMQTLQRSIADLQRVLSCTCRLCKEYYLRLYMQTLQRVLSKIVHADSAKSII